MSILSKRSSPVKDDSARITKADVISSEERPEVLRPDPKNVPAELKARDQWIGWKQERREDKEGVGKWTKVPVDPNSGRNARTNDPSTWGTFKQALDAQERYNLDGIGVVFSEDDPYTGVDLDDCRDPVTGKLDPWAAAYVERLASYTEVSPTGTGVKVWVKGKLPPGGNKKSMPPPEGAPTGLNSGIELYDRVKFFTVTGHQQEGTPARVRKCPKTLKAIHAELFPPKTSDPPTSVFPTSDDGQPLDLDDEEIIARAKGADNSAKFLALWDGDISGYPSHSEADLALCGMLARWTGPDSGQIDRLFRMSGLYRPEKWERENYRVRTIAKALGGRKFYEPPGGAGDGKKSQATRLVELVLSAGAELFHAPDQTCYATVPDGDHNETWPLGSSGMKNRAKHLFFKKYQKAPSAQAVVDAFGVLEGKALFEGQEREVHVRVAGHDGKIYLDLSDDRWQAVEIDKDGWRVINNPPVRFRRVKTMLPLPTPAEGGSLDELRPFVNVTDREWPLTLGWLVAALRSRGPYPVLCLFGEQGSAKSTTARVLRSLIDPNTAPVRAEPQNARDLAITANNGWVITLDNVSFIPPWLSDALCRLSTGGGFSTRTLYENDEETIFSAQRPAVINAIEEVTTRGDLLDRALMITCPRIPDEGRKTEAELWAAFDRVKARILGALCSAVSAGLKNLPSVTLVSLPRLADFAVSVVGIPALGLRLP